MIFWDKYSPRLQKSMYRIERDLFSSLLLATILLLQRIHF